MSMLKAGAILCLSLAALTACGASQPVPEATDADSAVQERFDWSALPVMGSALRANRQAVVASQREAAEVAQRRLEQCMAEQGFSGASLTFFPEQDVALALGRPLDEAEAEANGVGLTIDRIAMNKLAEEPDPPNTDSEGAQPFGAEGRAAMAACQGEAVRATPNPQALLDSYTAEVLGARAIREARQDWQLCMSEAGFEVSGFREVQDELNRTARSDLEQYGAMSDEQRREFDARQMELERAAGLAVVQCDSASYLPVLGEWVVTEELWQDEHAAELKRAGDAFEIQLIQFSGI